jgi:hypothetical protein
MEGLADQTIRGNRETETLVPIVSLFVHHHYDHQREQDIRNTRLVHGQDGRSIM